MKPTVPVNFWKIAIDRNIRTKNRIWKGSQHRYPWCCQTCGRKWSATYNNIRNGRGCPDCAKNSRVEKLTKHSIVDLQQAAKRKGGKCLESKYIGYSAKHKFRCKVGHEWSAVANTVLRSVAWCPFCAGQAKLTIDEVKSLAESRGGACLSETYKNNRTQMKFRCALGHYFRTTAGQIKYQSTWCSQCASGFAETFVRRLFEAAFNKPFPAAWPDWLKGNKGRSLQIDGLNEKLKLGFEHQGMQHHKSIPFFHKKKGYGLGSQRTRDNIKERQCRKMGIRLILVPSIPHQLKFEDAKRFLAERFTELKFNFNKKRLFSVNIQVDTNHASRRFNDLKKRIDERGGELIEPSWLGNFAPHWVKCGNCKHKWGLTPSNFFRRGDFCPQCGVKKRAQTQIMKSLVLVQRQLRALNIKMLSIKYPGRTGAIEVQCLKCRYRWSGVTRTIVGYSNKPGKKCPMCRKRR